MDSETWQAVSSEAKDLVRNLLQVDQNKRFNCKQVLAHPWFSEPEDDLTEDNLKPQ